MREFIYDGRTFPDPVMESFDLVGDDVEVWLAGVFAVAPDLLRRAREQWASSPRHPAYQGPPVPAPAPRAMRQTHQPVRQPAASPAQEQMQRMF